MKTRMLLLLLMLALPQAAAADAVPKPRLRPSPAQEQQAPAPDAVPAAWSATEVAEARQRCATLMKGLDIDYAPLDPIGRPGGCGAPAPVSVSRVAGVALTPEATLTCDMAAALHAWISDTLKPAARSRLKTEVTAIRTATSYACRRRNNSSSGKLSEHGRANALDMSGFSFEGEGKSVTVEGSNWGEGLLASLGLSRSGGFLDTVREGACKHFTTVLGPGSDPYHGDHFHVDVLRRKGDYRICQ